MGKLGYVEGKNYVIDFHWGAGTRKTYDWMARDMLRKQDIASESWNRTVFWSETPSSKPSMGRRWK